MFHIRLPLITFVGNSAHLAYLVHKSGRKPSTIIWIIKTISVLWRSCIFISYKYRATAVTREDRKCIFHVRLVHNHLRLWSGFVKLLKIEFSRLFKFSQLFQIFQLFEYTYLTTMRLLQLIDVHNTVYFYQYNTIQVSSIFWKLRCNYLCSNNTKSTSLNDTKMF